MPQLSPLWLFSSCDRGIYQVLGQMKMDMVNYTIQSLQPQLQEHSIQFERAQFQERLNKEPSKDDVRGERAEGGGGRRAALRLTSGKGGPPPASSGRRLVLHPEGTGVGETDVLHILFFFF